MERIHIRELQQLLKERGAGNPEEFLQILFDDPSDDGAPAFDEELADKVLTVNSVHGLMTITFNSRGFLRSVDIE